MPENLVEWSDLIFKPWLFWGVLLSTSPYGALAGYTFITSVSLILGLFLKNFTLLFLFWLYIGPILLATPILIPLVITSLKNNTPIGCGKDPKTGRLMCL